LSYKHFMVDIETTGTNASHNAVIQLAGVAFDLDNQKIHTESMFDQCLGIPPNRFWAEDTRDWWASQPEHILGGIWSRMRDPAQVMREFNQWVLETAEGETPVLWAKPISFEWPFLEQYYQTFGIAIPFGYWEANDLNSWCRARGLPTLSRDIEVQGDAHNALSDVLHQLEVLFTLMERTNVETVSA
jgi:DNA polymerase III alpha subunit (gram-positive type)